MAPSSAQYAGNAAQAFFGILSCTLTVQFDNEPATHHLNNLNLTQAPQQRLDDRGWASLMIGGDELLTPTTITLCT
jgi:hypothetical protein